METGETLLKKCHGYNFALQASIICTLITLKTEYISHRQKIHKIIPNPSLKFKHPVNIRRHLLWSVFTEYIVPQHQNAIAHVKMKKLHLDKNDV